MVCFGVLVVLAVLLGCVNKSVNPAAMHQNLLPDSFEGSSEMISKILLMSPLPHCSFIVVTDGRSQSTAVVHKEIQRDGNNWGLTTYEIKIRNDNESSISEDTAKVIGTTTKIRKLSWNTVVLLMSPNMEFLSWAGNSISKARLLVWSTRLIIVTSLPLKNINYLLGQHWTFSMMNTILLNSERKGHINRWSIYANIPYSEGPPHVKRIAFWNQRTDTIFMEDSKLFQEKFSSFHGSRVNITALPFAPYWIIRKQQNSDGSTHETVKGTDKILLDTMAEVLNFTVHQLPAKTWKEVTQLVTDRVSFLATVFHLMLPQRMDRYDYSYPYEFASQTFSAAKPAIIPQWQALYYPLANMVWAAIFFTILFALVFFKIVNFCGFPLHQEKMDNTMIAELVLSTLFSQPLSVRYPFISSFRVTLGFWLIFVFIITTVYRGNLTASLTLPKYPPRAETIEHLVKVMDAVVMPAYATEIRNFYRQSNSPAFRTLGQIMILGPTVQEGLQRAATRKEAFIGGRRYLEQNIAQYFTSADGTTPLYNGRENLIPGMSAWPIPHDAPFKPQIDRVMMEVIEGGLYEKWSRDTLHESRLESMRMRKIGNEKDVLTERSEHESRSLKTLTLVHMQGPFMLLLLGIFLSSLLYLTETLL